MKKKLFYSVAAVLFISFTACKSSNNEKPKEKEKPDVTEKKSTNSNTRTAAFSNDAPEGWTKTDTTSMGYRTLILMSEREGPSDMFRENVNVVTEKVGTMSFEDYMAATDSNSMKMLNNYKETDRKDITVDGVPAKSIDYSHSMSGYNIAVNAVLLIKNGTAYVITSSTEKGKMEKWRSIFDKAVASFHIN